MTKERVYVILLYRPFPLQNRHHCLKQNLYIQSKIPILLPLDEHSKTVTRVTVIGSPGGAEITHGFDWEGTSIRPGDRCRLHIACRIKVGGYLC